MWRIAQEALTNVERHAEATRARVLWRCNGASAALEITDNGQGFPIGKAGRLDSYGILGMRERASSIGATLELSSRGRPGHPGPLQPDPVDRRRAPLVDRRWRRADERSSDGPPCRSGVRSAGRLLRQTGRHRPVPNELRGGSG